MKTIAWSQVLLAGLAVLASEVRTLSAGAEERFEALANDDTGRVWATPREHAQELASFAGEKGRTFRVKGVPENLRASRLVRMLDGWVACLWRDPADAQRHAVSLHRGEVSRVWAVSAARLKEPRLVGCSNGSLLITEQGPSVVRLKRDDVKPRILTMPDALFHQPPKPADAAAERFFAPVCALEDAQHRVWLWSYALDAENTWRLSSLVAWRGDDFEKKEIAGLEADAPLSALAVADAASLWLPVVGQRLYRLDLATFRAEPVEVPTPVSFRYVENIFQRRGEVWAVVSPRPTTWGGDDASETRIEGRITLDPTTYYDSTSLTDEVWRRRDGQWVRMQMGLDYMPRFGWLDRPFLEWPHGVFIGSNAAGPWFFPADETAKPVWFWWERDFPLRDARQLCAAGGGTIVALDSAGELKFVDASPPRLAPLVPGVHFWRYRFRALQDRRGHVWGFGADWVFEEWDGIKKTVRELPAKLLAEMTVREFVGDDRDRGWLLPDADAKMAICDFTTGKWEVFESYHAALVSQLPDGVQLHLPDYPFFEPVFSGHGRIALFHQRFGVSLFDGERWQKWSIAKIAEASARLTGSLFFDRGQHLCVPLNGSIFQLEDAGTWRHFEEADAPERSTRPRETELTLPPGLPVASPTSAARDRFGTYWLTTPQRELVKALPGIVAPAIRAGDGNPFRYGAKIHEALVDPQGSALLRTTGFAFDHYEYVFVGRRHPWPKTTIEKVEVVGDIAHFHFSVAVSREKQEAAKAPAVFRWRVDDGAWQLLRDKTDATWGPLAAGEHRVEARAYGEDLVADPTPAEAKFVVTIDAAEQQRKLVAQLGSVDLDERERAVRALTRLGASVLPMLQSRRAAANADELWWIDSVIQQIERAQTKSAE